MKRYVCLQLNLAKCILFTVSLWIPYMPVQCSIMGFRVVTFHLCTHSDILRTPSLIAFLHSMVPSQVHGCDVLPSRTWLFFLPSLVHGSTSFTGAWLWLHHWRHISFLWLPSPVRGAWILLLLYCFVHRPSLTSHKQRKVSDTELAKPEQEWILL